MDGRSPSCFWNDREWNLRRKSPRGKQNSRLWTIRAFASPRLCAHRKCRAIPGGDRPRCTSANRHDASRLDALLVHTTHRECSRRFLSMESSFSHDPYFGVVQEIRRQSKKSHDKRLLSSSLVQAITVQWVQMALELRIKILMKTVLRGMA